MKEHPFFKGVNWEQVKNKELDPPFRPRVKGEEDVANFDKMYTEERIQESMNSAVVNSHQFAKFDGFTYTQSPKFEITTVDSE